MTQAKRLRLLIAAKLHNNQLARHLELFERASFVEAFNVVRQGGFQSSFKKATSCPFQARTLPGAALRMYSETRAQARRQNPDWVIGFNPVPWGTLAAWAADRRRTKICLSVIGRDYHQVQALWGAPFLQALRNADAVTVPGESMQLGMIRAGVSEAKVHILPHSVDTDRFCPSEEVPTYDLISVGQLIARKRMDTVIDAVRLLRERGHRLRLGILGKGPLEAELRARVELYQLGAQVTFLDYRDDVERVLQASRAFVLASEWEGVPFALMEAMAVGLVPFVTDVGSITDWVRQGANGHIFRVGDAEDLAAQLEKTFVTGPEASLRLRAQLVAERNQLSLDEGVRCWQRILQPS